MKKIFLLFLVVPFLVIGSCSPDDSSSSSSGTSISLSPTTLALTVGKTSKLTAEVTGATNKSIAWSSSNKNVADVQGGTVTAQDQGTAIITATSNADSSKKATCTVTVSPRPQTEIGGKDSLSGLTVAEYFAQKSVFIGWNLGNAFDANSAVGYGSWTRKIDADFLPKVKDAGFNMVRIPITWEANGRPIGAAPDYKIPDALMNEYVQVVDWAFNAGMVTIVNIHHDDNNWLALANLKGAQKDATIAKFTKVWEQIAERFKDYGDWLIFEPFNELKDNAVNSWGNNYNAVECTIINDLNQTFTDTVRATGKTWSSEKNQQRFLVVQPLCAKPARAMDNDFKIPTDTATGKQIISMHYYLPETFALNGTSTTWSRDFAVDFASYKTKFTSKGYPIIFGECGPTAQNRTGANKATADANRLTYINDMYRAAKANGIIPVYWDNGTIYAGTADTGTTGENFGLWDRRGSGNLEVFPGMQPVIDAMVNAVQD